MQVSNETSASQIGLLELIILYSKHLNYIVDEVGIGNYTYFNTRVTFQVVTVIKKRINQLKVMYQEPIHLKEANKLNGRIEGALK